MNFNSFAKDNKEIKLLATLNFLPVQPLNNEITISNQSLIMGYKKADIDP